jgi:hypothetical protein
LAFQNDAAIPIANATINAKIPWPPIINENSILVPAELCEVAAAVVALGLLVDLVTELAGTEVDEVTEEEEEEEEEEEDDADDEELEDDELLVEVRLAVVEVAVIVALPLPV